MNNSALRANEDITRELSLLLPKIKDPRVCQGLISITDVKTSSDLSKSKVYLSVYSKNAVLDEKRFMTGLKSATGFLRSELARALSLRHIPALEFVIDNSLENAEKINKLLSEMDIDTKS